MKKLLITISLGLVCFGSSFGQNSLGKSDDSERLAIATVVPNQAGNIPEGARNMLLNKMRQITTQNGLGASEFGSRFFMVPSISVVTKDITPTAPPQQVVTLEFTFYVVDAVAQTIFSQTSVQFKGVGQSEDKAYIMAIKNINPKMGQFKGFIEKGKEKIIEYYNSQCDVIIKGAQALAGQRKYEEAIFNLSAVPDVCRECYDRCMDLSVEIYKQYEDYSCGQNIAAAKAAWANLDSDKAAESLGKITPDASCYPEAQTLADEIKSKLTEDGKMWDFKMKKYDDNMDLQKQKMQNVHDIGVAWANNYWSAHSDASWAWLYH
jgi:hypothetical protein